jgi:hypothetical protein
MNITFTNFICFILLLVSICALCLAYLESNNISDYFKKKYKNKQEKLVGVVRVHFNVVYHSTYPDYDPLVNTYYVDVYCYESLNGRRKLNINPYTYHGGYGVIKKTETYAKLKDWYSGRSNLYKFPTCAQVLNGMAIITER